MIVVQQNFGKRNKVKYYKAMRLAKKNWYAESWGYLYTLVFPFVSVDLICEYRKDSGWIVTDRATGCKIQNRIIRNREELCDYLVSDDFQACVLRIIGTDYYKKLANNLQLYLSSFVKEVPQ